MTGNNPIALESFERTLSDVYRRLRRKYSHVHGLSIRCILEGRYTDYEKNLGQNIWIKHGSMNKSKVDVYSSSAPLTLCTSCRGSSHALFFGCTPARASSSISRAK